MSVDEVHWMKNDPMTGFETTKRRIGSYVEDAEQWKADNDRAIQCMDCELLLQHAMSVYEAINLIDESARHLHAHGKKEYTSETDALITELYGCWLRPHQTVLNAIGEFETDGFSVSRAGEFRSAVREVQSLLSEDEELRTTDCFVELRDQAIDDHRGGSHEDYNNFVGRS